MSELNGVRMGNFVKQNRDTITSTTRSISQLASSLPDALKQPCYVVKNPDSITDMPAYIAATAADTAEAIEAFRALQSMVDDYERVRDDPTQVDTVLSERGMSIASMSIDLIKG